MSTDMVPLPLCEKNHTHTHTQNTAGCVYAGARASVPACVRVWCWRRPTIVHTKEDEEDTQGVRHTRSTTFKAERDSR